MEEYSKSGDLPSETLVSGRRYLRIALNTPDFARGEDLADFTAKFACDRLRPDDILVLSAQAVAISQGRFFPPGQPTPQKGVLRLCRLGKKAAKSGRNPIFASPRILEALRLEYGSRITLAAAAGLIERFFFARDWFYRIAGEECRFAAEIRDRNNPQAEGMIVLPPENADTLAAEIAEACGCRVLIADLRPELDRAKILALSESYLNRDELEEILSGTPMRIGARRASLCVVRAL